VLVKTNDLTPVVAASSSRLSVPVMLVSTKSCVVASQSSRATDGTVGSSLGLALGGQR